MEKKDNRRKTYIPKHLRVNYKSYSQLEEACKKINVEEHFSKASIYNALGLDRSTVKNWKRRPKKVRQWELVQDLFDHLEIKLVRIGMNFEGNSPFIQFYLKNAYKDKYKDKIHTINEELPTIIIPD